MDKMIDWVSILVMMSSYIVYTMWKRLRAIVSYGTGVEITFSHLGASRAPMFGHLGALIRI